MTAVDHVSGALVLMARRGATPLAISILRRDWAGRSIELGLASWDILCTTLLPEDGALAAELGRSAKPMWPILPPSGRQGIAVEKMSPQTLAASAAARSFAKLDDDRLVDELAHHSIGAYEELRRRGAAEVVRRQGTLLERTRLFAHLLHLARLETLASFYLHYLWSSYGWAPALADLCEVLLDCGWSSRLPAAVADHTDLAEYLAARASLIEGTAREYHRRHIADQGSRWFKMASADVARTAPRLRMAEAEIGSLFSDMMFATGVADHIADERPTWRWGARVRAAIHARLHDGEAPRHLDAYLERFGSDVDLWSALFDGDHLGDWHRQLAQRASDEAAAAPHSLAAAWGRAHLSLLEREPVESRLAERIRAQCACAVG